MAEPAPTATTPTPRRGVLLAGGRGTRLYPLTVTVSKQLLPVYDKPLVYYPLTALMMAGVREIAIVTSPDGLPLFERLLGDGSRFGLRFEYLVQTEPRGIADALLVAEAFLDGGPSALVLGDNVFYGDGLQTVLSRLARRPTGASVVAYPVAQPERFGVVTLDAAGAPVALVEKPAVPASNLAVTGIYFYDEHAPALARGLMPSARGELEITDLNRRYLARGELHVEVAGRGWAWLDSGTPEALVEASQFAAMMERRTGLKIGCPEEVAWRLGYIGTEALRELVAPIAGTPYGAYLLGLAEDGSLDAGVAGGGAP